MVILEGRSIDNTSATAVITNCVPIAGPMVGCTKARLDEEYKDVNEAAKGAVEMADCVCTDVFGKRGTVFAFAEKCAKEVLSVDETVSGSILNLLELITGGVGNNLNPARLAVGLSEVPQVCEAFDRREIKFKPDTPADPATPTTEGKVKGKLFTEEQYKELSPFAVDVLSKFQYKFKVNGKVVTPLYGDLKSGASSLVASVATASAIAVAVLFV
ncbi:hypothetical protein HDU97_001670 [Phlyctochytrium planicorne]|nr:hypothetical protein HDU97_001670 [Phlyctochytrium planicorne]